MEEKIVKTKRIYWIDLAKIIAMIFVMLAHTIAYSQHLEFLYKYINSFHIPLFFLISGLTFNINHYNQYKSFLKKKIKTLIVPYIFWAVIFLIPYILLGNVVSNSLQIGEQNNSAKQIIGIIYGNGHDDYLKQNTPLWFLPCLFVTENIFYFIEKIKCNKKYYITMLVAAILGGLDYYLSPIILPWGIDIAIVMLVFFSMGKIIFNHIKENEKVKTNKKIYQLIFAVICIIIGILIQIFNSNVACVNKNFGNYFIFMISALFSVIGYILLIRKLPYSRIMQYAGQRTLAILIFHKIPVLLFQTKLGFFTELLKNSNAIIEFVMSILVIIISLMFSLLIEKAIVKLCPPLLGMNLRKAKIENEEK